MSSSASNLGIISPNKETVDGEETRLCSIHHASGGGLTVSTLRDIFLIAFDEQVVAFVLP
jgi:hypothetical protein